MLEIWSWYATAPHYVKLNFMVSLLNKCDQPLVHAVTTKVKNILDKYESMSDNLAANLEIYAQYNDDDSDSELVCDARDEYDDLVVSGGEEDREVSNIVRRGDNFGFKKPRHVDFIRLKLDGVSFDF
jgi:hypothetical protein